jgi:geranylgeranyl diphosphate synthase type II
MYSLKELDDIIARAVASLKFVKEPAGLYEPLEYMMSIGGKRLRPRLCLTTFNLFSDNIDQQILQPALALEIFHNFTLLHDDLMDRADMRRGKATVHKKWNDNTAILSGDGMLVLAYRYLAEASAPDLKKVLDLANETFTGIMEGQQYDMEFETRDDVREEEYIEMIRLKTSVLLAACVRMGAMLGGASEHDSELLYEFGEKIGLAFQLQDDLLDVYGDPAVFGKKIGGDILCNKKTYLYINAYRLADGEQKKELDRWAVYDGNDPDSKIAGVRAIYDAVGVKALSEKLINSLFDEAMIQFDRVNLPAQKKLLLREYAGSLLNRVL